jgi:hypothetical protein
MLVARLLATAALWVRTQTSLKSTKWTIKGVANTLLPAKKIIQKRIFTNQPITDQGGAFTFLVGPSPGFRIRIDLMRIRIRIRHFF